MPSQPLRVAIDLETTGLLAEQDSIIEIGAVKFAGLEVLDTFESFVATRQPLPYRVQRLTGIRAADLAGAPSLPDLAERLRGFLDDLPLVGHSVPFDAAFLRRVGLARRNPLVDTYELASALLPNLPSYTLEAVGAALGVASTVHHRALADAQLSQAIFLALLQRLDALDPVTLRTLGQLSTGTDWSPAYFIRAALRGQGLPSQGADARPQAVHVGRGRSGTLGEQLAAKLGLDPAVLGLAVAAELAPPPTSERVGQPGESRALGGVGERGDRRSEARDQDDWEGTTLVELDPDSESMLGYLERFVLRAASTGEPVIVVAADAASATRVARRSLPQVLERLDLAADAVSVAQIAERGAYLCLHRWFGAATLPRDGGLTREVARGLAKLAVWLPNTHTGARSEVALTGQESAAWERARAGRELVDVMRGCGYRAHGYCFATRAENAARAARVVITTHAALADELATHEGWLPPLTRVLVLDTHLLEDELRRAVSWSLERSTLVSLLANLAESEHGAPAGLLHLAARRRPGAPEPAWLAQVTRARTATEAFFAACSRLHADARHDEAPEEALLLDTAARRLDAWPDVEAAWKSLRRRLHAVIRLIGEVAVPDAGDGAHEGICGELLFMRHLLQTLYARLEEVFGPEREGMVYWLRSAQTPLPRRGSATGAASATVAVEPPPGEPPTLHAARIEVGELLAPLTAPGHTLVLAGSALAVSGEFDHTCGALGLAIPRTRLRAANVERTEQTMLLLPEDAPEPNSPAYQRHLDEALVELAAGLGGRTVAIFPSHAAVRAAYAGIRQALEQRDVLVLAQVLDGSARQLWQTFRSQPRVVLLGAGAFWEGVEPGGTPPACIVVARLPLPSLSDPLVAARAEIWQDPQQQFVVPRAALRLRQALNGLAWSHRARNAVVLFDRRVLSRAYGLLVLGTLPRCTVRHEQLGQLADQAISWVDGAPALDPVSEGTETV